MSKLELVTAAPNEIAMQRTFDAPLRLVVRAMTTPDLIKRWLGGKRAEVIEADVDLRVGGRYRYVFRRPDGVQFAFSGVYREIAGDRLVQTQRFDDEPGEALVTTTWTETSGTTTMLVVVAFESELVRDLVVNTGMAAGAGESYDQLDALLAHL